MKIEKQNSGFSLIEAVVATAVFAFFMASILGVYMSTLRLDSRTRAQRAVTDNARFILDFLAKEVRNGHIDYTAAACSGVATSVTDLCLVNQNNEKEHIYAQVPSLLGGVGTDLIIEKTIGSSSLNSNTVRITGLTFVVSPVVDPFTAAKAANEQPHVTVLLQLTARSTRDPVRLDLQSTFTENYYPAR